jgi:hypothetical protein
MVVNLNFTNMMNTIYPVGSIIFSIDNLNPQSRFGGTWVQISQGRFVAGVGTGNDGLQNKEFAAGNTTGEYEHQLTIAEMPNHTHPNSKTIGGSTGDKSKPYLYMTYADGGQSSFGPVSPTDGAGGGQYHNNTPPGFGMYVWQRTALA